MFFFCFFAGFVGCRGRPSAASLDSSWHRPAPTAPCSSAPESPLRPCACTLGTMLRAYKERGKKKTNVRCIRYTARICHPPSPMPSIPSSSHSDAFSPSYVFLFCFFFSLLNFFFSSTKTDALNLLFFTPLMPSRLPSSSSFFFYFYFISFFLFCAGTTRAREQST